MCIDKELLELVRCPRTRQSLAVADDATLARVNQAIDAGRLRNGLGKAVTERLTAALISEDGETLYPVIDDIPILLVDEAVAMNQLDAADEPTN